MHSILCSEKNHSSILFQFVQISLLPLYNSQLCWTLVWPNNSGSLSIRCWPGNTFFDSWLGWFLLWFIIKTSWFFEDINWSQKYFWLASFLFVLIKSNNINCYQHICPPCLLLNWFRWLGCITTKAWLVKTDAKRVLEHKTLHLILICDWCIISMFTRFVFQSCSLHFV